MKNAFIWSAAVAYLIVLLMSPLDLRNLGERVALEILDEDEASITLQVVEYSFLFEVESRVVDSVKEAVLKNGGYMTSASIEQTVMEALAAVRSSFMEYARINNVEASMLFLRVEVSESNASDKYDLMMLNSKGFHSADAEGAIKIRVKLKYKLSRRNMTIESSRSILVLCPYRMFLIKRAIDNALFQVETKTKELAEGNWTFDFLRSEIQSYVDSVEMALRRKYSKRAFDIHLKCRVSNLESGNNTVAHIRVRISIQDSSPAASVIAGGKVSQPSIEMEGEWSVAVMGDSAQG